MGVTPSRLAAAPPMPETEALAWNGPPLKVPPLSETLRVGVALVMVKTTCDVALL